MNNTALYNLWVDVSQDIDIGTFEFFKTAMNTPSRRKAFHDDVSRDIDLGTFEEFERKIGVSGGSPTTQAKFLPCVAKKGKPLATKRSGMVIKYNVAIWDKPVVAVYQTIDGVTSRFQVLSGMHKSKMGTVRCTETGKIFFTLDEKKSSIEKPKDENPITGGEVKKSKNTYYDCTNVNIDTTPLTYGCKSPKIAEIQKCLGINDDGKFGPNTRKALIDNAYDMSKGITKDIYTKVLAACNPSTTAQTTGSIEGGADVNYLRNPIKMNFGPVPQMPAIKKSSTTSASEGMTDTQFYNSLREQGMFNATNFMGTNRLAYNGPVLEPSDKEKLDRVLNTLEYTPTKFIATDEGARYVWKK